MLSEDLLNYPVDIQLQYEIYLYDLIRNLKRKYFPQHIQKVVDDFINKLFIEVDKIIKIINYTIIIDPISLLIPQHKILIIQN